MGNGFATYKRRCFISKKIIAISYLALLFFGGNSLYIFIGKTDS